MGLLCRISVSKTAKIHCTIISKVACSVIFHMILVPLCLLQSYLCSIYGLGEKIKAQISLLFY